MSKEVRTYIGLATAKEGNTQEYPSGERHAFNLFLLQEIGADENCEKAEEVVCTESWTAVEFRKTVFYQQQAYSPRASRLFQCMRLP